MGDAARSASILLLLLLLSLLPATAAQADDEASYEFLTRQGQLLYDYGKFDEAASAFAQACATREGAEDFECWRRLGTAAEQAARVELALNAWAIAAELPVGESIVARQELDRLLGSYGAVRFTVPAGRELPSAVGVLEHSGLLIDPLLKAYVATVADRVAEQGIDSLEVWLPPGEWSFEGLRFEVAAGSAVDVDLPARLVPWRTAAFRAEGAESAAPEGGPWEVGVDFEFAAGGVPGGELGLTPAAVGGRLRFGRRLGPVRLELLGRVGSTTVTSESAEDRSGSAMHLLGQLDLGVDLAPHPRLRLTPHAGVVAGSLGNMLVDCRAVHSDDGRVWDGECRMGSLGAGAQAGVDLSILPPARMGNVAVRVGLFGEAIAGGLLASPGDPLAGGLDVELIKLKRWRFTALRGGVDVGLSLRF